MSTTRTRLCQSAADLPCRSRFCASSPRRALDCSGGPEWWRLPCVACVCTGWRVQGIQQRDGGGVAHQSDLYASSALLYTLPSFFQSLLVILFAFLLLGVTAQHMVHRHTDTTENRETNTQPHNTRVTTRRSTNIPRSCATSRTDLDTLGHVVTHEQNDRHKTTEMARSRKDHSLPAATDRVREVRGCLAPCNYHRAHTERATLRTPRYRKRTSCSS